MGYFCGGSIIDGNWILTAAHCADGAFFIEVVAGAHNIRQTESTQQRITSYDFTVHENWDTSDLSNDLALIELPETLQMDSNFASGISPVLRTVTVPVISNRDCNAVYGIVGDGVVCVDTTGGKGSCNGDSGGPLTLGGRQVGIVSFGASAGCEVGYPAGYSRVAYYRDWISRNSGV